MSRAEAAALVAALSAAIDALLDATRDLRVCDSVPQHVLDATRSPIRHIEEAAQEIGRIHGITP